MKISKEILTKIKTIVKMSNKFVGDTTYEIVIGNNGSWGVEFMIDGIPKMFSGEEFIGKSISEIMTAFGAKYFVYAP